MKGLRTPARLRTGLSFAARGAAVLVSGAMLVTGMAGGAAASAAGTSRAGGTDEVSVGQVSAGQAAAGPASAEQASAEQVSAGQVSAGQVYVVQAILGTTPDVVLDGRRVAPAARPETVIGPVSVPAGQHVLALQDGGRAVTRARFRISAGQSVDLVASRTADHAQTPQVVVFRNDLNAVGPGKARLVVAHTAVAPPADVRVDTSTLFRDISAGEALSLLVPARSHSLDVRGSQASDTILAPVRVSVRAGTLTRVFVVGDPSEGTAGALVQVLSVPVVGAGRPRSVPTGDGGQAAQSFVDDGPSPVRVVVSGVVLALLGLAGIRSRRRRALRSVR